MAEALAFDTHRFIKRLVEHGFTQEQAEVLSEEQVQLLNSNLVTKTDFEAGLRGLETGLRGLETDLKADIRGLETGLKDLETDLKADIKDLRVELKADNKDLEIRLIKWMMAGFVAQGGLVVALIKLLL